MPVLYTLMYITHVFMCVQFLCGLVEPLQSQIKMRRKGQSVYCVSMCAFVPVSDLGLYFVSSSAYTHANLLFLSVECCEAHERPTSVHYATGISALPLFV